MKKFFQKIADTVHSAVDHVKSAVTETVVRAETAVSNTRGEGYVDSGVKILIAVVIGALLLSGLYALFNTTVIPTLGEKITEMFSYTGNAA